jgi:hypothetical protein
MERVPGRKKKRQRRRAESEALVKQYRESGLTQRAWCEQSGNSLSALRYWLKRECREEEKYALVPVQIRRPKATGKLSLEVSGIRIQVDSGSDPALLASLLKELG